MLLPAARRKRLAQCAQHGQNLVEWKEPTGAGDGNRSETARRSREVKPKEADSKLSAVGIRTGSEAGCGRQAGWEQQSPKVTQTHPVKPGGARGQSLHLTWGDLLRESGRLPCRASQAPRLIGPRALSPTTPEGPLGAYLLLPHC